MIPAGALDMLGLSAHLRTVDDEAGFGPYFSWAEPDISEPNPDPYAPGLDRDQIALSIEL